MASLESKSKLLFSFLCCILCASCEKHESESLSKNLTVKKADFTICAPDQAVDKKECISSSEILSDIYKLSELTNGVGVTEQGIVSVTHAIQYKDKTDLYAIFLTQLNEFQNGAASDCHACGAALGIVVYQSHNGWKLFAAAPVVVKDLGSWGRTFNGDVDIRSTGPEELYVMLKNGYMAQGYESEEMNFISIHGNSDAYEKSNIQYMGGLEIGSDNCGGNDGEGTSWEGVNIRIQKPNAKLLISYDKNQIACGDNNDRKIISSAPVTYVYDWAAKKFTLQEQGSSGANNN
ncbi:MAG: hypothetical protein P4M15_00140 [Alphaproteobacteria bacterium]|nr:hypothetical protein [Alphaproteobacteria bacterium]